MTSPLLHPTSVHVRHGRTPMRVALVIAAGRGPFFRARLPPHENVGAPLIFGRTLLTLLPA